MRWVKHVANMEEGDVHTGFCWGDLRSDDHFENKGVNWWIILRFNFQKYTRQHGLGWPGSGQGQVAHSSKHVDEYWVPYNTGNVWLDQEVLAFQEGLCSIGLVVWLVGWLVGWVLSQYTDLFIWMMLATSTQPQDVKIFW